MLVLNILVSLLALLVATSAASVKPYSTLCDTVFCRIVDEAHKEIATLKTATDEGASLPDYGQTADRICNSALEKFAQEAPIPDDDKSNEALYDKKVDELEKTIDAPLHVIYLKQLSIIREKAIRSFKTALTSEGSEYEAMMMADELFRREAEAATRLAPDWEYAKETQYLKQALTEIATRARKITEVKLKAQKDNQQMMQYLQMQNQQLQAIQQQIQGSSSPWNVGFAYRVPDSNFNINCNYQQGRGSIQISCVPDEAVPMLGSQGFVNGVTPGNVGVSFNINI